MRSNRYFIPPFLSIAICVSMIIAGCEETPSSTTNDPIMQATVDGTAWTGTNVDGTIFSGLKSVTGTAADGSSITLILKNITTAGSLQIDGLNVAATYIKGGNTFTATSGTINVTELDASNNISGTFEFDGTSSGGLPIAVEGGSFTATLR